MSIVMYSAHQGRNAKAEMKLLLYLRVKKYQLKRKSRPPKKKRQARQLVQAEGVVGVGKW